MAVELYLDILHLVVSGCAGIYSTLLNMCMFGFFSTLVTPIHVDGGPDWHHPPCFAGSPLLHNLLLLLLFPVQHSTMPRGPLKKLFLLVVSERYYRTLYVGISSTILLMIFYFWQPMTTVVWNVSSPVLHNVIVGLCLLSWVGVVVSLLALDPLSLLGISKSLTKLMGWQTPEGKLVQTGVYGLVRHPVYTCLMLGMWITPTMTVGHLLITAVFSLYTVLATIYCEEPDLVKTLGPDYLRYMEKTPRFFPLPGFGHRKNE